MNDATGAIYSPPKSGMPFLVVTFADGAIHTETAASRSEARVLLAGKTRRPVPHAARPEFAAAAASDWDR
jgi:hypothetical protein